MGEKELRSIIKEHLIHLQEADSDTSGINIPPKTPDDDGSPATSRQTYALYVITKKDFRKAGLTYKQASELITQLNKEKGYNPTQKVKLPSLKDFYIQNIDRLVKTLNAQMGIKGQIGDDPAYTKPENIKTYAFFGGGMGFAWLKYDKRSKLAKTTEAESTKIKSVIDKMVIDKAFTKEQQLMYKQKGWPLEAMTAQNMAYKMTYMNIVADYLKQLGVENVYVEYRLD